MKRSLLASLSIFTLLASSVALPLPTHAASELIRSSTPTVYYLGSDGKRYVFPNERTFFTWYSNFSTVRRISDSELSTYSIGGNVTERPGVRLVKITTVPRVYAISRGGTLRWIQNATLAQALYGTTWNKSVDDIPDVFFSNYHEGTPIANAADFNPANETAQVPTIDIDKNLATIPVTPPVTDSGNPVSGNYIGALRTVRVNSEEQMRDATNQARPGDVIRIARGTYTLGQQWWIEAKGTAAHPIYVVADAGRKTVDIHVTGDEGINLGGAAYLTFEDLEVSHTGNNIFHVQNGSNNIILRNLDLHDAGSDGDVIKINQASHITIEGCDVARPGARADTSNNGWQETIDLVDASDSVIRRNFLHDFGNLAGFIKGGSQNVVMEENVIDNQRAGAGDPAWGLGGWTDADLLRGAQYEAINTTFRHNIIMHASEGALALYDAQNTHIQNNLFLNNARLEIESRAGNAPRASTDGVQIQNNRFVDTRGSLTTICQLSSHRLTGVVASGNVYWNNGSSIPTQTSCGFSASQESGAQTQNPGVTDTHPTTYTQAMALLGW